MSIGVFLSITSYPPRDFTQPPRCFFRINTVEKSRVAPFSPWVDLRPRSGLLRPCWPCDRLSWHRSWEVGWFQEWKVKPQRKWEIETLNFCIFVYIYKLIQDFMVDLCFFKFCIWGIENFLRMFHNFWGLERFPLKRCLHCPLQVLLVGHAWLDVSSAWVLHLPRLPLDKWRGCHKTPSWTNTTSEKRSQSAFSRIYYVYIYIRHMYFVFLMHLLCINKKTVHFTRKRFTCKAMQQKQLDDVSYTVRSLRSILPSINFPIVVRLLNKKTRVSFWIINFPDPKVTQTFDQHVFFHKEHPNHPKLTKNGCQAVSDTAPQLGTAENHVACWCQWRVEGPSCGPLGSWWVPCMTPWPPWCRNLTTKHETPWSVRCYFTNIITNPESKSSRARISKELGARDKWRMPWRSFASLTR